MKYALILPDGAADEPLDALDGRTPLEAARTPHLDRIAAAGQVGTVVTVPSGFTPGSDVATLSVVGYDPVLHYTGRAPLEAVALGLELGPDDVVFRCNLSTVVNGAMSDFSAGHIEQQDAEPLIAALNEALATDRLRFFPGVMYRHLMVLRQGAALDVVCTPPHDIPGRPVQQHLPSGRDAKPLVSIMQQAERVLERHPVNARRREAGKLPANVAWLWGHGRRPELARFESRYGLSGASITAVDLIRGISLLVGWSVLPVEGATGYLDTNYQGKGQRAVQALEEFDLVCVHIEAPDEAGHNGDLQGKIQAIERIDERIVGPVLEALRQAGEWKILVVPDHPTPVAKRTHTAEPPPFCLAGSHLRQSRPESFDEAGAARSGLRIDPGHRLMQYFLNA